MKLFIVFVTHCCNYKYCKKHTRPLYHGLYSPTILKNFFNPLPGDKFLDASKLKEFAGDNFKFDENGRKLSKWVEKTVGKGEIPRYEQFLLFPQCFQKACFPAASKGVIVWEWVNLVLRIFLNNGV